MTWIKKAEKAFRTTIRNILTGWVKYLLAHDSMWFIIEHLIEIELFTVTDRSVNVNVVIHGNEVEVTAIFENYKITAYYYEGKKTMILDEIKIERR